MWPQCTGQFRSPLPQAGESLWEGPGLEPGAVQPRFVGMMWQEHSGIMLCLYLLFAANVTVS